ncbi:glycosyltransferase family 4 protein [uncultured Maribacter sp.]|uniref:glycosyltransferase family 4 protein n=1 Tax=uncultured Maribacter sp. TaxID=431308 RepID=UPI0030EEE46B|tara:strand:- start:41444 stop:42637 length:1194 start_codon:yes stop_codon:yes gene_type:complete
MKILYLHQYFKTPDKPGGTRSYWNSLELIKNGHSVTVICYSRDAEEKISRETRNGIDIITLKIDYSQSMGVMNRLKAYIHFMLVSTHIALKQKDIDFVIATSTPLTIGFPALVLKKFKKIPYLFEVRDLWPEVPIQMGGLKNKLLIKLAKWFEKTIYKNASHIVALSPGMEDGVIETGIPKTKITMIPNMAKIDEFWSRPLNKQLIEELKINPNTFKVIYFGAMGEANAIEYILETADLLKENKDIEFIFIGNGAKKDLIIETIENKSLGNVSYLGLFAMEKTSELVNICDVSLVTFSNIPILYTNSPNKLFDSLSAGKPIIVNSKGWTKKLVEEHECGIFVDPESPQDFAEKLLDLKESPQLRKKMGINSRKLAETEYDKSILCEKFASVVNSIKI